MTSDTYLFQLDFQDEAGWVDITNYVDLKSISRKMSIYNNLKPTANTLKFDLLPNTTIFNQIMTTQGEILFSAEKNSAAYFTGYLRRNFGYSVRTRLQSMTIEVIDNIQRLMRKCMSDLNYVGYDVIDTSTTTESIVHKVLTEAGFAAGEINVTSIAKTIDYFTVEKGKQSFSDILTNLLFEYGYSWYCDASGDFRVYNWAEETISTTKKFGSTTDTKNMIGEMRANVKPIEIEGVDVAYWPHYQITDNIPVFNEQEGSDQDVCKRKGYNCLYRMEDEEYYPPNAGTQDVYVPYTVNENSFKKPKSGMTDIGVKIGISSINVNEKLLPPMNKVANEFCGHEVICVPDITCSLKGRSHPSLVTIDDEFDVLTLTNYYTRAKVKIQYNSDGAYDGYIVKFQILGKPIMRGDTNIVMRRLIADTEKILSIKAQYLVTEAEATKLASALERYYRYGVYTYQVRSQTEYEPGDYAYVDEDFCIGINTLCRVISRTDDEWMGEYTYTLEGVAAYEVEEITVESIREQPSVITPSGVETVVDKAPQIQHISSSGTTTYDSPGEGDLAMIYEDGAQNFYEYTGGAWVQTTALGLGKIIGSIFTGIITCLAIMNSSCSLDSGEWLPNHKALYLDFENNYEDQFGTAVTHSDAAFSSTIKKFGSYSVYGTDPANSHLEFTTVAHSGQSQMFGTWIYLEEIVDKFVMSLSDPFYAVELKLEVKNSKCHAYIRKSAGAGGEFEVYSVDEMVAETWHHIGFVYDKDSEMLYVVLDNKVAGISTSGGSWAVRPLYAWIGLYPSATPKYYYLDDMIFFPDGFYGLDLFPQHYNHDIPWSTDYAKDDVTLIPASTGRVYSPRPIVSALGVEAPHAIFEDQKSQNTSGGSFSSGADRTRDLNTTVVNTITGCSLASNRITLPAGKYLIRWSTPAYRVDGFQSFLYDYTNSAEIKRGSSGYAYATDNNLYFSSGAYELTVTASTEYEIRARCTTTKTTDGFGRAANFGTEVYTRVEIYQLA